MALYNALVTMFGGPFLLILAILVAGSVGFLTGMRYGKL